MDELLLSKIRLSIVSELLAAESRTFTELQKAIKDVTVGNLTTHLDKLAEGGYVDVTKRFVGRRPQTSYRLTKRGRAALIKHVDWLNAIISNAARPIKH